MRGQRGVQPNSSLCFKKKTTSSSKDNEQLSRLADILWTTHDYKPLALGDSGLRVRVFFSEDSCGEWVHMDETIQFLTNLPSVVFFKGKHSEIVYQLEKSKFIGFASVVVLVHTRSLHHSIVEAMSKNKYLRYLSKVILCRYHLSLTTSLITPTTKLTSRQMQEKIDGIKSIFLNLGTFIQSDGPNSFKLHDQYLSIDVADAQRDYKNLKSRNIVDNLMFVQWFTHDGLCNALSYAMTLFSVLVNPFSPLEPTLRDICGSERAVTTTSTADQYVYSINPALAIIINNNHFTGIHEMREGSEQDVVQLIRELKIARIPYILIEDSSQDELLEVFHYLGSKDFRPLKSLLLFLMSHGGSNDVMFTHDGQVNIKKDVVKRIQANQSLENADLQFVINMCRGTVDMQDGDFDDLDLIQPTDDSHLHKNTIVMYSVPDEALSPRSPEDGCPFVQSLCKNIRNIEHTVDIRELNEKINNDLKEIDYFYGQEKCSELIVGDADQIYTIRQTPKHFFQMVYLLKSIARDFPFRDSNSNPTSPGSRGAEGGIGSSSYVCGVLNAEKFPKQEFVQKYFAPALEEDTFSVISI